MRGVVAFLVCTAFGAMLLYVGLVKWHDRAVLHERGVVVTGTVVEVHRGRGPSVTVRFTTATGMPVETVVDDPPVGLRLAPGAPIELRYDPADPSGRVMTVGENQSRLTLWFLLGSGTVLLALAGYGTAWWILYTRRRRTGRLRPRTG